MSTNDNRRRFEELRASLKESSGSRDNPAPDPKGTSYTSAGQTGTDDAKRRFEELRESLKNTGENKVSFDTWNEDDWKHDSEFINSFFTDAKKYLTDSAKAFDGISYSEATDRQLRDARNQTSRDLADRADAAVAYINKYKDVIGEEEYARLIGDIQNFRSARLDIGSAYRNQERYYGQWDTEEAYNQAVERSEMLNADLGALEQEIDALKAQREKRVQSFNAWEADLNTQEGMKAHYEYSRDISEIDKQLAEKEAYLKQAANYQTWHKYRELMNASDFREKSQYVSTANGKKRNTAQIMFDVYTAESSGWDDPLYEYINGNKEAGVYLSDMASTNYGPDNAMGSFYGRSTESNAQSQQMTKDEVKIFNYIYATQGKEAAHDYYNFLQSDLNLRQRIRDEEYAREYAKESPVLASTFSVLTSPMKGLSYVGQVADYLDDGKIDQNAAYNKFSYANSAIRGQVAKQIEESGKWGKVGSFAYQTGMSMGDFLMTTAVTGGNGTASMLIMGSGAAADTTIAAKDRGLSDEQAFQLGTVAGLAEALCERVSLGSLLDGDLLRDSTGKYILKNMVAEGLEEVTTDGVNLVADILISKDQSEWQMAIDAYMKQGKTEEEAFALAMADQALTMGLDFLGGAISGGIMSSGGAVAYNRFTNKTASELADLNLDKEDIQAFIETGLESDKNSASYKIATEMQNKTASGKELSPKDISRLYQANVQAIQAEENAAEIQDVPPLELRAVDKDNGKVTDGFGTGIQNQAISAETSSQMLEKAQDALRAGEITEAQFDEWMEEIEHQEALENSQGEESGDIPWIELRGIDKNTDTAKVGSTGVDQNMIGGNQNVSINERTQGPAIAQSDGYGQRPGADLLHGGGQRYDGTSAREQTGGMAGGTGQTAAGNRTGTDTARAAVRRSNLGTNLRLQKVSSTELGLNNGTEKARNQVIPREYWDESMIAKADQVMQETGKEVTYVLGSLEFRNARGGVSTAKGATLGDRIIVQANHTMYTAEQIADHEAYHGMRDVYGQKLSDDIVQRIREDFTEEEFQQVLYKYIHALRAVYDLEGAMDGAEYEQRMNGIIEELLADAHAGMNMWGAGATKFTGTVNRFLDENNTSRKPGQENGVRQTNGPPAERFSAQEPKGLSLPALDDESESGYVGHSLVDDPQIYTYDFLTAQPNMKPVELPGVAAVRDIGGKIDTAKVVEDGMKNALSIGTERDGRVYVKNRYTNRELWVTTAAIRHGLNGTANRMLTNARLGAVIGDVVQNAIPINALHNTADGVEGTYAMAGYAYDDKGREFVAIVTVEQRTNAVADISTYDMTHAISGRQKRSKQEDVKSQGVNPSVLASEGGNQADTKSQGFNLIKASSEISIADMLTAVKEVYQSILSEDVLAHLGETRNPKGHYTGRVRFSYAGENAETADLDALARAKEMQAAGVADETIRQQTGWHTGMDGKWRWEIDDSGMEYSGRGDLGLRERRPEYARYRELLDKANRHALELSDEALTPEEAAELQKLKNIWGGTFRKAGRITEDALPTELLSDYVKHDALFEAYPQLRKTRLRFADLPEGTRGQYDPEQDIITLSNKLRGKPQDTLIHEIQHVIQKAEGFSRGSSVEYWTAKLATDRQREVELADKKYRELFASMPEGLKNKVRAYNRANLDYDYDEAIAIEKELLESEYGELFSAYQDADFERRNLRERYEAADLNEDAATNYWNTAGEIEARDAASRRQLTVEQRRNTAPARADDHTVFVEDVDDLGLQLGDRFSVDDADDQVAIGDLQAELYQLQHQRRSLLEADTAYAAAADNLRYANTFTEKVAARKAMAAAAANIDTAAIDQRISDLNEQISEIRNRETRRHREDQEKYSGTKTAGYSTMPDTRLKDLDQDYMKAVRSGDRTRMAELVEQAAEAAMPASVVRDKSGRLLKTYHHTGNRFTVFDRNMARTGTEMDGFFFAPDPDSTSEYGSNMITAYLNITKLAMDPKLDRKFNDSGTLLREKLAYQGYDGMARTENGEIYEYMTFDPEQIKSADPVVYDDRGRVVPLSERFNFHNPDIRYSVDEMSTEDYDALDQAGEIENIREALPTKAKQYLSGVERKFINTLGDIYGVPRLSRNEDLMGMVRSISDESLRTGSVTDNSINKLFDSLYKAVEGQSEGNLSQLHERLKNDFRIQLEDVMAELRNVKLFMDEHSNPKEPERVSTGPMTYEEAKEMYKKLKDARRNAQRTVATNLLSESDEEIVGKLLRGEIALESLDSSKNNTKGIEAVYKAKREYEELARLLEADRRKRKSERLKKADGYLETANSWKDKKTGLLYSRETMTRNVLDIVPDRELGKAIVREYFEPIAIAEGKSTRFKTKYRDRVRDLNLSRKAAKNNLVSEAHAVQLLGEAQDNIRILEKSKGRMRQRDGKTLEEWRAVVANLWEESPGLDRKKIEAAVQTFRNMYDELFELMNKVRIENGYEPVNYRSGYFPHFQPGEGDGILAQFGKAMGIDTQVDTLPTTINGLTHTFKPGIQWFGNAQERLGFNTVYDAVEGFDKYIEGVSAVIHHTENIQRLRAFGTQARYRTSQEGIRKQVDAVCADPSLNEESKRLKIEDIYKNGKFALSNFVAELDEYTNLLANKKSRHDRNIESKIGRKWYTIMKNVESRVAVNAIAGNLSSALTNVIPLSQAWGRLGTIHLMKGIRDSCKAIITKDSTIVDTSTFLTNRRGSDPLVKNWVQKTSSVLGTPMEFIDNLVSEAIVRGAFYQNRKRGLSESEAIHQADLTAASIMADRSKGAMPTLFEEKNPLTKLFTQFQLEVNNQYSEIFKDIPREYKERSKRALALCFLKYFIGALILNELEEEIKGRRSALDPIGISIQFAKDVKEKGLADAAENLAIDVAGTLPFSSSVMAFAGVDAGRIPLESAIPNVSKLWDAAFNDQWSTEKRIDVAGSEVLKPLTYLAPPFGGGNQLVKSWKGIKAYLDGGSYGIQNVEYEDEKTGKTYVKGEDYLQYPVYKSDGAADNFWDIVRATMFGKSALDEAQAWVDSGFDSLSAKQTAIYKDLVEAGIKDEDAFDLIDEIRNASGTEEKSKEKVQFEILRESDMALEGKAIIYYGILASESERELMDSLADEGADSGKVGKVLMTIKDAGSLKGAEASCAKRDAIVDSELSEEEKIAIYRAKVSDSRDEEIEAFREAGLGFDEFARVQNQYALIGEKDTDATAKATAFSRWIDEQKFTDSQEKVIKDSFAYYNQIPANSSRYDKLVESGMDPDDAYDLTGELGGLEPEDGATSVSDLQKWRTCVDFSDDVDDQLTALFAVMTDAQYQKVEIANDFGVTPAAYVTLQEIKIQRFYDGDGSYKNSEIQAAIDAMPGKYTRDQKAVLWQLATGSESAKNNPYSRDVGQQVLDAKEATKNREEEPELPGLTLGNW